MKSIIFVLITIAALSSCKGECKYDEPIEGFFVTHWEEALPRQGKVYSFKAGTNFTAPIDSFNLPVIERIHGYPDWISFTLRGKMPTHKDDIRLVLDDTLVYDISDITLSWFVNQKQWTMRGPREYGIVSSLKVNGRIVRGTIDVRYLRFPREYARVLKELLRLQEQYNVPIRHKMVKE